MKKGSVIVLLLVIIALTLSVSPLIIAQDDESSNIEKGYLWLINQVDGKWTAIDTETNALALLALSHDDRLSTDGKNALLAKKNTKNSCWPSASCKAKDTALAVIALNNLGIPVDEETEWLKSREVPFKVSGITWLLQTDTKTAANCSIIFDSKEYVLQINEDKTYKWEGGAPSCLSLTDKNYWIKISTSCLDEVYSISCDAQATVSLPYRIGSGISATLYVPSETLFTPADVLIKTVCIREGATCNYESTMWTAYALQQAGEEYTQLLPYLIGESSSNKHLIPDSILALLTEKESHRVELLTRQNRRGYWSEVRGKGKYWDTALAVRSVFDYASDNVTLAKKWILDNQNSDGSFGTTRKTRDTAFVLNSLWPKAVAGGINDCEAVYGYFCRTACESGESSVAISCALGACCKPSGSTTCNSLSDCSKAECNGEFVTDILGTRGQCEVKETICDDSFDNDNDGLIDNDDPDCQVTCFEIGGTECSFDESCDVNTRRTLETDRCCTGTCAPSQITCGSQGGEFCSTKSEQCDGSILSASDASTAQFCCVGSCKSQRSVWPWIIILLLIVGSGGFYAYKKGYLDRYINKLSKYFKNRKAAQPKTFGKPAYRPPVRPYSHATAPQPHRPSSTRPMYSRYTRRIGGTRTEAELKKTIEKLKTYTNKKS